MTELFKDNLKIFRTRLKLTQEEAADKIGVKRSTYAMYERGSREPSYETLEAIADVFNVNMSTLLGECELKDEQISFRTKTHRKAYEALENLSEDQIIKLLPLLEAAKNIK